MTRDISGAAEHGRAATRRSAAERRPHRAAVIAVIVVFAGAGITMASSVSRMPEIKERIGASATELAFALVCLGIGSLIAMPFAGKLTSRFGTARVTAAFTTIALVGWSLIPLARTVPQLAVILLLTGMGVGTWDVAMNMQGSMIERRRHQVLMPLWHGLFSIGGVLGAGAGAAAAHLGIAIAWQLPLVSLALWIAVLLACREFIPNEPAEVSAEMSAEVPAEASSAAGTASYPDTASLTNTASSTDAASSMGTASYPSSGGDHTADVARPKRRRSGITRTEILVGLIVLGTAIGEGAANDWLAVALVDGRGAPAAVGALAYAGFNLTMAIGRFSGGVVISHIGRTAALRVAGCIGAGGLLVLCLVPLTWTAFVGAAAWGLGFSVVFPSGMSAAGEIPGRGERAIATVSAIGYGGFLFGAPMIGGLAHVIPLLDALLVVAVFALVIVVLAPAARERSGEATTVAASDSRPE